MSSCESDSIFFNWYGQYAALRPPPVVYTSFSLIAFQELFYVQQSHKQKIQVQSSISIIVDPSVLLIYLVTSGFATTYVVVFLSRFGGDRKQTNIDSLTDILLLL